MGAVNFLFFTSAVINCTELNGVGFLFDQLQTRTHRHTLSNFISTKIFNNVFLLLLLYQEIVYK